MHILHCRRIAGAVLLIALAAAPLAAQEAPALSLEEALAAARARNPEMLIQRNDAVTARGAVRQARADFIPSAQVSTGIGYTGSGVQRFGSEVFGERPQYYSSNWNVGLSYQVNGAKLMQPAIARAQQEAAESRIVGYQAGLENQVAQQYLAALQALEQAQQAEREVERTAEHERLAEARLQVGIGIPLDVRRAQVERGRAEAALLQARHAHSTELLRLGRLMGHQLPEGTVLSSRFELFEPRWEAEDLVAAAIENNPDLLAARAGAGAAERQVRAARSAYLPSLSAQLGLTGSVYSAGNLDPLVQQQLGQMERAYGQCADNNQIRQSAGLGALDCAPLNVADPAVRQGVRDVVAAGNPSFPFGYQRQPLQGSITVSLPIFDGMARERRVGEARVAASNAELNARAHEQRLQLEVRSGLLSARTAFRAAELQRQVAANAADELRMSRERFRLGAAASLEVTDAQTRLAEAERAVIDAVYTYHKSLAALEALVGRSLR
jgi:outer membrane protein